MFAVLALFVGGLVPWIGCDGHAEVVDTGAGGGSGSGAAAGGGVPTEISPCLGHVYACGDLVDNDSDTLVDSQDPDCLGACDNTEESLYGGIPGQAGPGCDVDCYFDQDSGNGNDDCFWNHQCDPHEVAPDFYPEPDNGAQCTYDENANISGTNLGCVDLRAAQSQACLDYCGPLTPNGCDCFGCCELPAASGNFVWLGSEGMTGDTVCTLDAVNDPTVCHPCEPVDACLNGCGKCEICLGKTELPPECSDPDGGEEPQCGTGVQPCGLPGQAPCPTGSYCITGCCQELPT
jgi:hypothetical protein